MAVMVPEEIDKGALLVAMRHTIDRLELQFAQVAAEFHRTDQWDREGFNTSGDWIRINCNMTSGTVWNALAVGEQAQRLPLSLEALHSGDIGFAHLATMANTADKLDGFDEARLLPLAKEHSPGKFYRDCLHYRHSADAKGYGEDQERLAEERSLRLNTAEDGCLLISGVLDPVGGAAVRSALEPLAGPSGQHDDRNREQRMADALIELASGGKPAELQVTTTVETLKGLAGAIAGEMEFAMPLSSATVQRLACDCSVMRVILDGRSMVIDVGRSKRLVGSALRKVLAARDKHCQWPACERPASWCDGYHLVHWIDGGETNLDNCVLLCKRHHRMVHEGDWKLIKVDGRIVTVAPTITFGLPTPPHSWGGGGAAAGGVPD